MGRTETDKTLDDLGILHYVRENGLEIETPKRVFSCNLVYSGASERSRFLSVKNRLFSNVFKGFQACSGTKKQPHEKWG